MDYKKVQQLQNICRIMHLSTDYDEVRLKWLNQIMKNSVHYKKIRYGFSEL